jgi:aryl-alcohol dehydrogenase-like predicted oxidoreductase
MRFVVSYAVMNKVAFGRTGLEVSVLGFGSAPVGFLETDRRRVAQMLNLLLDSGVNVMDTGECYAGAEEMIGEAIGHRRDEYVLVTKCGHTVDGVNGAEWSAELIAQTVERSLRRLRTDRLDAVVLHGCSLETLKRGEALGALVAARRAGQVRFVGYSGDNEEAAHAAALSEVSVIETSVSICDQANIELVLPLAQRRQLGVIAKRPLANSAWRPRHELRGFYGRYAEPYAERLRRMGLKPAELGFDGPPEAAWPEIALRFTISVTGVHTAIVGTTSEQHVRANLAAAEKGPLPVAVCEKIREAFRRAQASAGEAWTGLG